jgi:hypothetical protein
MKEVKVDFKPRKDYAWLPTPDLFREWLALPTNSFQRFFVYQGLKGRPYDLDRLNERERQQLTRKKNKEKQEFRLQEAETLIYCNADLIHPPILRAVCFFLSVLPFFIVGIGVILKKFGFHFYEYDDLFLVHAMAGIGWFMGFWVIRMFKLFATKVFITSSRIGFSLTIWRNINFHFSYLDISSSIILADLYKTSSYSRERFWGAYMGAIIAIRQIDNDILRRFWLPLEEGVLFLECLAAIVRDTGGAIYIPKFVIEDTRLNGRVEKLFSHQFSDCQGPALKNWYARVRQRLTRQNISSNSDLQQLLAIASFIDQPDDCREYLEYPDIKKQLPENVTFLAKIKCTSTILTYFKKDFVFLTNQGFIHLDNKLQTIKGIYPYHSIKIEYYMYHVMFYKNNTGIFMIDLLAHAGEELFNYPLRFPLRDTLRLFGCRLPSAYESGFYG